MSKHHTLRNVIITAAVVGTAMHVANEFIMKYATSKDLLKKDEGKFYSFKYGNVYYKVSGEGKPVLLIHDINECSSGMEWYYLEKKLSKTNKVYTIDLLGCGRSDKAKLTYNSFLYVQLITEFIRDVIGETTDIIATGKSVAPVIMSAKLKEESIDRIILINPSDLLELRSVPDTFCKIKQYIVNCPVLGTFVYHMFHTKDCVFNKFINEYFSDPNADFSEISDYYFESAHEDKSGSKYLYASLLGETLNMNIDHGVKVLDKDIIIISGDDYYESEYVPEEYAELNDNIECISIMETSYLPQLENPTKVMDIIEEYWK
jgi:pimeloyl-ACP methyl ester carboxylesterase